MAIALLTETALGSVDGATVTTTGIVTTGASLIVVAVTSYFATTAPTLSDSQSNTPWLSLTAEDTPSIIRVQFHYFLAPSTSGSHTFTASGASSFPTVCVMAFSGTATSSAFDQENGGNNDTGAGTQSTGNVTPSANNELLVTVGSASVSASLTVDGYYTPGTEISYGPGQHFGGRMGYAVQTTATTKDATWSCSGAGNLSTAIATFKEASGGGGGAKPWLYRQHTRTLGAGFSRGTL